MIHKLTDRVWFGDARAPMEAGNQVCAVLNVAHVIRRKWDYDLNAIPHGVAYFRLASPDREPLTLRYLERFLAVVRLLENLNRETKLPVLTHCQFGGHRGPASAIATAFLFEDNSLSNLKRLDARAFEMTGKRPITDGHRGRYYSDIYAAMESLATKGKLPGGL